MTQTDTPQARTTPISIHIPRVGDDVDAVMDNVQASFISIHIPRVGDDSSLWKICNSFILFQSTSPVWGMTSRISCTQRDAGFQSTSPVWGMTQRWMQTERKSMKFQSTSPVWGMTNVYRTDAHGGTISIHIPRVGDDVCGWGLMRSIPEFQSTSPVWGMTETKTAHVMVPMDFNPHPPCGG